MELRTIGLTEIKITPVAMGCWPIAGVTSLDVNDADSIATLHAAVDAGINFFDTAYCYGYDGESEKLVARALGDRREEIVIASKGGIHWVDKQQQRDGRPATIIRECEESLQRLNTDVIDLHYLHCPDPATPVEESATAFVKLLEAGKIRSVGVSNFKLEELKAFSQVCPISAYQPRYNMLQREIENSQLPWCIENDVSVMIYWPFMKGLLAGKMERDHKFAPNDKRLTYPVFQGAEWDKTQDFLDVLRALSAEIGKPVSEIVVNWTIHQPGVTAALCGAKRPEQIHESAAAMDWQLAPEHLERIEQAIDQRGPIQQ